MKLFFANFNSSVPSEAIYCFENNVLCELGYSYELIAPLTLEWPSPQLRMASDGFHMLLQFYLSVVLISFRLAMHTIDMYFDNFPNNSLITVHLNA